MIIIRRVVGSSMQPKLKPGKIVIALRRPRNLTSGHIVIIEHAGKEKIKRIARVKHSLLYVLGDNPMASTDSRHFGWVQDNQVKAKVIWPRP